MSGEIDGNTDAHHHARRRDGVQVQSGQRNPRQNANIGEKHIQNSEDGGTWRQKTEENDHDRDSGGDEVDDGLIEGNAHHFVVRIHRGVRFHIDVHSVLARHVFDHAASSQHHLLA